MNKNKKTSDIVKEAIAEAKLVRDSAVEIAAQKLQEKYTPQLQRMVNMRLENDMEEEEISGEEDLDVDMDADLDSAVDAPIDAPVGDDEDIDLGEADEESLDTDGDGDVDGVDFGGEQEDEDPLDAELESIMRELEGEDDEMDVDGDVDDLDGDVAVDAPIEDEEDIDLDEIIREIEAMDGDVEMDDEKDAEIEELKSELAETKKAYDIVRKQLTEINLLNNKLLYVNKLFNDFTLTKEQKNKVIGKIDLAENVREVKLTYATLAEGLRFARVQRKNVFEGKASAAVKSTKPNKQIVKESADDQLKAKFQRLAGINKK